MVNPVIGISRLSLQSAAEEEVFDDVTSGKDVSFLLVTAAGLVVNTVLNVGTVV